MDQKCLMKLTKLRTELEIERSTLEIPSANLNLAKILELSEGIKHMCGQRVGGILPMAETIENFKKNLNTETQNRLQEIINMVQTIIKNNQN